MQIGQVIFLPKIEKNELALEKNIIEYLPALSVHVRQGNASTTSADAAGLGAWPNRLSM